MSVEAITWALRQPIKHSSAKFVLVVLANNATAEKAHAWPSVAYLSTATGQDRKTVLANLQRLLEWGMIEDTGKRTGETKQVVVYRLVCGPDLFAGDENSPKIGTVPKTEQSQNRNSSENGSKESRFSVKESQKRDTEPSITNKNHQPSAQRSASRFDEFWQVYPKRVGRKPSLEKWKAKKLDALADTIVADVRSRIENDGRWLDGYIPDPRTYLTQERWTDELQPRRSAPQPEEAPSRTTSPSPAKEENPLEKKLNWIRHQRDWLQSITPEDAERQMAEVRAKYGAEATT